MNQFLKKLTTVAFTLTLLVGCGMSPATRRSSIPSTTNFNFATTTSTSTSSTLPPTQDPTCSLRINNTNTFPVAVTPQSSVTYEVTVNGGALNLAFSFDKIKILDDEFRTFVVSSNNSRKATVTAVFPFQNQAVYPVTAYVNISGASPILCSGQVGINSLNSLQISGAALVDTFETAVWTASLPGRTDSIFYFAQAESNPDVSVEVFGSTISIRQSSSQRFRYVSREVVIRVEARNNQGNFIGATTKVLYFLPRDLNCHIFQAPNEVKSGQSVSITAEAVNPFLQPTGESLQNVKIETNQPYINAVSGFGASGAVLITFQLPSGITTAQRVSYRLQLASIAVSRETNTLRTCYTGDFSIIVRP
ncbi:MAG: hypothetical protein FJ116_00005 [Deltaproteobacteria bacterium]|nr:hypothetical protein [Deltaproteobacteria bacterium]